MYNICTVFHDSITVTRFLTKESCQSMNGILIGTVFVHFTCVRSYFLIWCRNYIPDEYSVLEAIQGIYHSSCLKDMSTSPATIWTGCLFWKGFVNQYHRCYLVWCLFVFCNFTYVWLPHRDGHIKYHISIFCLSSVKFMAKKFSSLKCIDCVEGTFEEFIKECL